MCISQDPSFLPLAAGSVDADRQTNRGTPPHQRGVDWPRPDARCPALPRAGDAHRGEERAAGDGQEGRAGPVQPAVHGRAQGAHRVAGPAAGAPAAGQGGHWEAPLVMGACSACGSWVVWAGQCCISCCRPGGELGLRRAPLMQDCDAGAPEHDCLESLLIGSDGPITRSCTCAASHNTDFPDMRGPLLHHAQYTPHRQALSRTSKALRIKVWRSWCSQPVLSHVGRTVWARRGAAQLVERCEAPEGAG